MGISEFNTYGTPGYGDQNNVNTTENGIIDVLGMLMLHSPKTQVLWASQLLVNMGFSEGSVLIMMLGVPGILESKLFSEDGEIHQMLVECVLLPKSLEDEDDPVTQRIMKLDIELLEFMVVYKINEFIEADKKKRNLA